MVFVKGMDRLVVTHMRYGARGLCVLDEFLGSFYNFTGLPKVYVVVTMSDQFWVRYWLSHPSLSVRGCSLITPLLKRTAPAVTGQS